MNTISEGKYQSRGSKFLAYLFPMTALPDLEEHIARLKQSHVKARHFCYAYRIIMNGHLREYCSDAGEPGGSAGVPILSALKSEDIANVGCVVVRYFGGTKLGVPGLIEAYGDSAVMAISEARIFETTRTRSVVLSMPIAMQPLFMNAVKRLDLKTTDHKYDSRFEVNLKVPLQSADQTIWDLLKILSDRDYDVLEEQLKYLDIQLDFANEE